MSAAAYCGGHVDAGIAAPTGLAGISADTADLAPRDMIDLQSYIWVLGSDEYD